MVKSDVPATLESICKKAMAVRPEGRYPSALALAADIQSWLADEPVEGVRESAGPRLGRWERRHRTFLRVAALALIAVALVAIAAALMVNRARERAENRRRQAIELGQIADASKDEAHRQRDALRRLTTRLTLDRGLSLLEHNDRRTGLLWLARVSRFRAGMTTRSSTRFAPTSRHGAVHSTGSEIASNTRAPCATWPGVRAEDRSPQAATTAPPGSGIPSRVGRSACPWRTAGRSRRSPILTMARRSQPRAKTRPPGSGTRPPGSPAAKSCTIVGPSHPSLSPQTVLTLITASTDGTLRLWDGATGQPRGLPLEPGNPVKTIAIAPDGKTMASLQDKGTGILWDLANNRRLADIEGSATMFYALAFSPDSATLACGGEDRLLRLVDASNGKVKATSDAFRHGGPILAVTFTADGTRIATGSYDTACRICACPTSFRLESSMEQRGHVWDVAFNPAGTLLATAADDNTARVWDVVKFEHHGDTLPHPKPVRAVAFSPDGRSILTGCKDNAAQICNWATSRPSACQ